MLHVHGVHGPGTVHHAGLHTLPRIGGAYVAYDVDTHEVVIAGMGRFPAQSGDASSSTLGESPRVARQRPSAESNAATPRISGSSGYHMGTVFGLGQGGWHYGLLAMHSTIGVGSALRVRAHKPSTRPRRPPGTSTNDGWWTHDRPRYGAKIGTRRHDRPGQ